MIQYDVIIIGTGAAAIIADAALRQGLHIAIIERGPFGGTCLNRGCIPTKVMVTAANAVRDIAHNRHNGRPRTAGLADDVAAALEKSPGK